jgi:hypothetical protein
MTSWVSYLTTHMGEQGSAVVEALCINREVASSRPGDVTEFTNLPNPYGRIGPWGLLSL